MFPSRRRLAPAFRDLPFGRRGRRGRVHHHAVAALAGLQTGWFAGRLDLSRDAPPDPPESPR